MAGNSRVSDAFIVHPYVGYAQIGTHVLLLYFLFLTGILVCYPLPLEYTFPPLRCKDGILWYERDHGRRKDFLKIRSKMLDLYKLIWYSLNSCSTFVQCG
jgi:hypothetical protein